MSNLLFISLLLVAYLASFALAAWVVTKMPVHDPP